MKYVQNFLSIPVSMMGNTVVIAPGKSAEITDREAENQDVMYAVRKQWIKVTDTMQPDVIVPTAPAIVVDDEDLTPAEGFEEVPSPEVVKKAADKVRGKVSAKTETPKE